MGAGIEVKGGFKTVYGSLGPLLKLNKGVRDPIGTERGSTPDRDDGTLFGLLFHSIVLSCFLDCRTSVSFILTIK